MEMNIPSSNRENAQPKVMASFYKAVVKPSIWQRNMGHNQETKRMYQIMDSFHGTASRRIAKLPIKYDRKKEEWIYPTTEKVYQKAKMQPLYEYLHTRRKYILPYAET